MSRAWIWSLILRDETTLVDLGSNETTVIAGTKFFYPLTVERQDCLLKWDFMSNGYDIRFGIAMTTDESTSDDLEFLQPVDTYLPDTLHEGEVLLETPGRYILVWDNSNSWLREKTIHYHIQMTRGRATPETLMKYAK